jgi:tetraacyldisaccharide 4'-kinase
MLRESRSGAKRAQAIVVTKCPMALSYETRSTFQLELNVNNNQKTYFSYIHYREQLSLVNGGAIPISTLRTSGVLLFTGIANPTPLIDFLKGAAAELSVVQFADHHPYSVDDLQTVKNKFDKFAVNNEKAFIITTRKDWMRIQSDDRFTFTQNWTLAVIDIDTDFFDQDKTDFNHIILNYVHQKHSGIS